MGERIDAFKARRAERKEAKAELKEVRREEQAEAIRAHKEWEQRQEDAIVAALVEVHGRVDREQRSELANQATELVSAQGLEAAGIDSHLLGFAIQQGIKSARLIGPRYRRNDYGREQAISRGIGAGIHAVINSLPEQPSAETLSCLESTLRSIIARNLDDNTYDKKHRRIGLGMSD